MTPATRSSAITPTPPPHLLVDFANRPRLPDVEHAKDDEARDQVEPAARHERDGHRDSRRPRRRRCADRRRRRSMRPTPRRPSVPTAMTTKSARRTHHAPTCARPHAIGTASSVPQGRARRRRSRRRTTSPPASPTTAASRAQTRPASCHFFAFFATDAYTILHVGFEPAQAAHRLSGPQAAPSHRVERRASALERAARPRARAARDLPRRVRRRPPAPRGDDRTCRRPGSTCIASPRARRSSSAAAAGTCSSSSRCPARATPSGRAVRSATTSSAWISCTAPASSSSTWRAATSA